MRAAAVGVSGTHVLEALDDHAAGGGGAVLAIDGLVYRVPDGWREDAEAAKKTGIAAVLLPSGRRLSGPTPPSPLPFSERTRRFVQISLCRLELLQRRPKVLRDLRRDHTSGASDRQRQLPSRFGQLRILHRYPVSLRSMKTC